MAAVPRWHTYLYDGELAKVLIGNKIQAEGTVTRPAWNSCPLLRKHHSQNRQKLLRNRRRAITSVNQNFQQGPNAHNALQTRIASRGSILGCCDHRHPSISGTSASAWGD
jgi:hypothetical protein